MARNITNNEWQILNVLTCNRCNLKTSDMALLQAHHCKPRNQQVTAGVSYNLVNAKFTCSVCTVELSESEFCEHLEGHLTLKPYVCKYCNMDFSTRGDVCEHLGSVHQEDEQTFVFKLTSRTKDIIQKAKNVGKVFYKPVNVPVGTCSNAEIAMSKTTTQNLTTVPVSKQPTLRVPVASSSRLSSLGSSSTVRGTLPTAISPVSLGAQPHLASQLTSNTVLTSARPQLPAEQKRYFVLLTTQPQTGSGPTSTSVLQTQAPSCLSQNVCTPASDTSWRHQFSQKFPGQVVVGPMFIQRFNAQRSGIQRAATTLPSLVAHPVRSAAPSVVQNVNTRGVHFVTNVSPASVNQVKNAPAVTVPPVFNLSQVCLSSPSVQNTPGTQLASTLMSSALRNTSASLAVSPDTRTAGNPVTSSVLAVSERNSPLMSADMSVNCQSPIENDAGNIFKVSIQQFPKEVKSSVESDNVNGDFVGNESLQINQEASSLATEVSHERSPAAVIKSEHSTDGDTDTPLQIRIENIMSLAACQGDFEQCVQDNATDTIAGIESSTTETGSKTTENQLKIVGSSNFSFLRVVKGYFLCLVCQMKWLADYDLFFKHIWEKHTHGEDFSCCPTGYSPYCARLDAIVKTIYDKSQEPMTDQIRSYFTPKSPIETENENVQNISSESSNLPPRVETVKQIIVSESPSSIVPRLSSVPRECEKIVSVVSVSSSSESSSPPKTLVPDHQSHMIENEQNYDFDVLTAGNELEKGAQDVEESAVQIGKHRADKNICSASELPATLVPDHQSHMIENEQNYDFNALTAGNELEKGAQDVEESSTQIGKRTDNICSASELRDFNVNNEILQNIMTIDLSSSVASNSVNEESNTKNIYEDVSDDDRGGINYHNHGTGSINYSLADGPYSDELPLDLSTKTTQSENSHNSLAVTPMFAAEMATMNSVTNLERLSPERIDNSCNSFINTPLSLTETAVTSFITQTEGPLPESIAANPRTRAERQSTDSIGMGDDDDVSLRCFYGCGICATSFATAMELEEHVLRVHILEQNLPCAHCGFRCQSSKHLIQHMDDHLASDNRKTFSCSLLENSDKVAQFENNDMKFIIRMLKTSLLANSDIDAVYNFACNTCQSEFADLDQLGLHLQESLLKVIECKHCTSFFLNTFSWQKHMVMEHVDLPRMYCIKRKLLCYERKKHSNVPQQALQEAISCLSNIERDAERSDYQCEGTHESHGTSVAAANVLDEIETVASNVIDNSEVCSKVVELTERHSDHKGRDVADGIEAQTTHEHISKIPNLLDLVKTSAAMRSWISAVSLNAGKAEQSAVAITGPNRNERRGNCTAQQCESGVCTSTVNERRGSFDVDLHGLVRPVSSRVNDELREMAPDLTAVKASMVGNDGLMQVKNSSYMEDVQPVSKTSTSVDSSSVKSALSSANGNLTSMILEYENQCCQGVVAEIPLDVQASHDIFDHTLSESISTLTYNMPVPLNNHCLNEKTELSVVGQAEAASEVSSQPRVKHTSPSVVGNTDASSDLSQATCVENQDGCDVTSVSPSNTVSCNLPQASDSSCCSRDYFNITPKALSLPVTRMPDFVSTSAAGFNLDIAETRIIVCVSEKGKLENTENTCLPVEDIGADIDNRQESRRPSVVLENNLGSGVEHDIDGGISTVVKDDGDQTASPAGTGISETKVNGLLKEPCANNRSHGTPDGISVLKTVSHDSSDIVNPATRCLSSDRDIYCDIDFSCSKDPTCNLQESVSDFAGNDEILENDTSYGHDLLHHNIDKTTSNLTQEILTEKQVTYMDGSYDEIHYNKNSHVSTKDVQLYASNETSACIESGETCEENVLNSPSHSDISMEENNNTASVDQTSIASNITENKDNSHTETNDLSDNISTEHGLSNSLVQCNCGTLISGFTDGDHNVQSKDKSPKISFTGKCAKCRLVTEESSHPDNTTENVNSKTVNTVPSKDSKSFSEKAVENCLRALKRRAPLISENSGKINRLENVDGNHGIRAKVDPPESSSIKLDVLSGRSKACVGPEIPETNPTLKSDLETVADNGSRILSENKNTSRDFTSNRDMLNARCKRRSEAGQIEGVISSKLLRINSEKHKSEDAIKKLDRAVAVSQSPKDISGADEAIPDSARFRCSVCPLVTSQSYTELKQHVKTQHHQDKSARVCRIRSRSLQNAAGQLEVTLPLQEVQNNDVAMLCVHSDIAVPQHTQILSETNIGYCAVVNKSEGSQKTSGELNKLKETVIMQGVSKVGKKSSTVESIDMLKLDSKPHFKCSVCIFLTSHSYTEMQQHVKSQHSDDKSAKVNRIDPKSLLSAAEQFAESEPSKKVDDLTSPNVKQCFKCSVCISLSSHSYTEMKQHILLQHPHDISAKICRVNSKSSCKMRKEQRYGIYKCIHPKCTFTRKWNLGKMKAHIESKHPYYSCGYCKATYTVLAFLYNHLKFVHRGKKARVMNGTIDWDLLFKRVDIPCNELGAECKDVTSQTPAKRKKLSQSSVIDDVKKSEAKASSELKILKMKGHTPVKSCDVNVTNNRQNQPLGDSKTERSKGNNDSHSTAAQGLKTPHCKLAHSKFESILNVLSPVPKHEISSVEKLTVTSKTTAISENGDSQSAKTERHLFKTTMNNEIPQLGHAALLDSHASSSKVTSTVTEESDRGADKPTSDNTVNSTFPKTVDPTHRIPHTVSLHTKKTAALGTSSLLSPRSAQKNTKGNKVTEFQELDQHSSAQNVCSKMRPLGPVPSQNTVRKDNSSAAASNCIDINVCLNSATVQSSGTVKKQNLNSVISDKQESISALGNVQETLPEICSETASRVASAVVTPQTQDQKHCGTWGASQLEAKTATEGNENEDFVPEDLRTAHSENNLSMQNKNKTESVCESSATTDKTVHKIKLLSKHDYPFRCTACSRIMKCVRDIEKHYNSDHPTKDIKLTERRSGFVYSNSGKCIRWKDDKKAPTDAYMCSYCAFRNIKRSDVEDHIRRVHRERDIRVFSLCKPNTDRNSTRSDLTSKVTALQHEASRSNSPALSYFCNLCSEVKNSEFQLRLHLASHRCFKHTTQLTAGASFLCHTCGYIAKSNSDFAQHTGEHLSERRFKCFMCEHDSHHKKSVRVHIKSVHHKIVDDDVGIIDRNKPRNVDLRPRLVNIDPRVALIDPFRQHPNYLQRLVLKHGIKTLDLPGDFCTDILTCEHEKYGKYFDINKVM